MSLKIFVPFRKFCNFYWFAFITDNVGIKFWNSLLKILLCMLIYFFWPTWNLANCATSNNKSTAFASRSPISIISVLDQLLFLFSFLAIKRYRDPDGTQTSTFLYPNRSGWFECGSVWNEISKSFRTSLCSTNDYLGNDETCLRVWLGLWIDKDLLLG